MTPTLQWPMRSKWSLRCDFLLYSFMHLQARSDICSWPLFTDLILSDHSFLLSNRLLQSIFYITFETICYFWVKNWIFTSLLVPVTVKQVIFVIYHVMCACMWSGDLDNKYWGKDPIFVGCYAWSKHDHQTLFLWLSGEAQQNTQDSQSRICWRRSCFSLLVARYLFYIFFAVCFIVRHYCELDSCACAIWFQIFHTENLDLVYTSRNTHQRPHNFLL